jgi:pimeloyl-ACP methyl ester carboxylesterase
MKRRYLALPLLIAAIVLLAFVQIGSDRLTSPPRAPLTDYHFEILRNPGGHGIELSKHHASDGTPYLLCQPGERLSPKGRLLRKQLARRDNGKLTPPQLTLVILHGHGGRKEDSLSIAERFCALGFSCLLLDLHSHGESPHPHAAFGKKEVPQLKKLLPEIVTHHQLPTELALLGFSQGGAIALQLAAESNSNGQFPIVAVISFSAFANLATTVERAAHERSPIHAALLPLVSLNLNLRHQLDLKTISPVKAASRIQIPTLIVHGNDDRFVFPVSAKEIHNSIPSLNKELILVAGAGHHDPLLKGKELYATMAEFFLNALEQE